MATCWRMRWHRCTEVQASSRPTSLERERTLHLVAPWWHVNGSSDFTRGRCLKFSPLQTSYLPGAGWRAHQGVWGGHALAHRGFGPQRFPQMHQQPWPLPTKLLIKSGKGGFYSFTYGARPPMVLLPIFGMRICVAHSALKIPCSDFVMNTPLAPKVAKRHPWILSAWCGSVFVSLHLSLHRWSSGTASGALF